MCRRVPVIKLLSLLTPNLPAEFPTVVVELGLLQTPLLLSQLASGFFLPVVGAPHRPGG